MIVRARAIRVKGLQVLVPGEEMAQTVMAEERALGITVMVRQELEAATAPQVEVQFMAIWAVVWGVAQQVILSLLIWFSAEVVAEPVVKMAQTPEAGARVEVLSLSLPKPSQSPVKSLQMAAMEWEAITVVVVVQVEVF
jgi:hypothetical protein